MKNQIGPFKLYTQEPNDIQYGSLYTMNVILPVPNCKKRTVRVYLPEGFSFKKRYPVLYMLDGQNIVDKYTTAYGSWDIDVRQHELIQEGVRPFIVVGLDCPKVGHLYRVLEYTLMDLPLQKKHMPKGEPPKPYSNLIMDYFVNKIKPLVDSLFPTLPEKEFTGIGGSSMGGLGAFNFATVHKDVFGFALSFSPAFFLFDKKVLYDYVETLNINPEEYGKFYFYSGDKDFEHEFLKSTIEMYQYFLKRGFSHEQVALLVDSTKAHCEASWSEHFPSAIRFWLQ